MKVLHVLRHLNPGGIECWLERLCRHWMTPSRPEVHIALEDPECGSLVPRFSKLGVRFHHVPTPSDYRASMSGWHRLFQREGPFQVVHSHIHHASVLPLVWARKFQVPVRIAHSHADFRPMPSSRSRSLYFRIARRLLPLVANRRIATSPGAACDLFGSPETATHLFPCGSDFEPLLAIERRVVPGRFTLAHVGRFVPEKNHEFLLRLFAAYYREDPRSRLLLIGDGPLRGAIESLSQRLGVASAVDFAGTANPVGPLLAQADMFVFPSVSEGLGLAAIEAQAAGLPVLLASHLPSELNLFPENIRRLALNVPMDEWMSSIRELRKVPPLDSQERRLRLADSPFTITANIRMLERIYAV
jgi:glycosyltransferase involved in cell wall biosynthesis